MALQRAQVASILRWVLIAGKGCSKLGVLSGLPTLSLVNMFHVTNGGFGT
jgi:hypothetical protein